MTILEWPNVLFFALGAVGVLKLAYLVHLYWVKGEPLPPKDDDIGYH